MYLLVAAHVKMVFEKVVHLSLTQVKRVCKKEVRLFLALSAFFTATELIFVAAADSFAVMKTNISELSQWTRDQCLSWNLLDFYCYIESKEELSLED